MRNCRFLFNFMSSFSRKNVYGGEKPMRVSLKKTQKIKPLKKIPETDAIFDHVHHANQASDQDQKSLRLSIDSKAKVKIGNLSRGGEDRTKEIRKRGEHDTEIKRGGGRFWILHVVGDAFTIFFGQFH